MTTNKPALWTPGDWNAFFGFGTNILVNMLVLTGLLRFVLKMPDDLVFGRILPAAGLMMALSTMYYAWLAYRLAQKTGRDDVCALPSGISVPHMFVVVFVIMLPISAQDRRPGQGLGGRSRVGLRAELRADGRRLRRADRAQDHAARCAARHARRRVDRVHLDAARGRDVHDAGHRHRVLCDHSGELVWRRALLASGIPAGLVAIAAGTAIAWASTAFGVPMGGMSCGNVTQAFANFGFSLPLPAVSHVFAGFDFLGPHPGHRDPVRHLRSRRSDGQRGERRGCGRQLSDDARPHRRRRREPRSGA